MTDENVVLKVKEILENNGLIIYENESNVELQYDSLQFISIISELETCFSIVIPDEVMVGEGLETVDDFCNVVESCM